MDLTGGLTLARKPKIACSLEPELAFLKNVKGVSAVFNRVFLKIFDCLAELETDRLSAWTALVNGKLEVEVTIRPKKEPDSKPKRWRQERSLPRTTLSKEEKEKSTKEDKTLLHNLVGKFDNFDPSN